MEKESITIKMDQFSKVNFYITNQMDLEWNLGQMVLYTREILKKVKNLEKDATNGIKDVFILANGRIIKFMGLENMIGLMEGYVDR